MSRTTGTLTINSGFSRLDDTRLMKGAVDNGGFGRATTFLRQDRQLNSGETIFVDGDGDTFQGAAVIVITDAGRPAQIGALKPAANAAATSARRAGGAARSSGGKKGGRASAKKGAKKSGRGRTSAKKSSAKKSAKKSTAKKSGAKKSTR